MHISAWGWVQRSDGDLILFLVMSTDSEQISFNILEEIKTNARTNIFMDFSMEFLRDFFMK